MFDDVNCTEIPQTAQTDAGVAGAGVMLSFIITNFIALGLAATIIFTELSRRSEAKIMRKLLLSFSDQQIITGIGILCVGLAKMTSMIPYHFFIVWMLSCLSTVTHIATLLALANDFRRDWLLRWLRQVFMFINLVLSVTAGVFVLNGVIENMKETLPIACVWHEGDLNPDQGTPADRTDGPLSTAGTIAVIAGQVIVFVIGVWYLHLRERKWLKVVQVVAMLVLMAMGIGVTVRVIWESQAFGSPKVDLVGPSEGEWTYGQTLSMLLLVLPVLSALEILRGEVQVKAPLVGTHIPLDNLDANDSKNSHHSFQPNPFWGNNGRD